MRTEVVSASVATEPSTRPMALGGDGRSPPGNEAAVSASVCRCASVTPRSPSNHTIHVSATAAPSSGARMVAFTHSASGRVGWLQRRK